MTRINGAVKSKRPISNLERISADDSGRNATGIYAIKTCYLEFMQQNKITYAYVLINFSFSKNINNQSILLQHLSIHVQHFVHTVSTFSYKMFN